MLDASGPYHPAAPKPPEPGDEDPLPRSCGSKRRVVVAEAAVIREIFYGSCRSDCPVEGSPSVYSCRRIVPAVSNMSPRRGRMSGNWGGLRRNRNRLEAVDCESLVTASAAPSTVNEMGLNGFDSRLVHQTFIPCLDSPQVAESRCSCTSSNKAVSVERDFVRKEQSLEPLSLFE